MKFWQLAKVFQKKSGPKYGFHDNKLGAVQKWRLPKGKKDAKFKIARAKFFQTDPGRFLYKFLM